MRCNETFFKRIVPELQIISGDLQKAVAFSLDSRTIEPDELFVPIKGEKVDGHQFVRAALQRGAGTFIAAAEKQLLQELLQEFAHKIIIVVAHPQQAFFALAAAWRAQFTIPLIAVTGSVGKTTTKSLITDIATRAGKNCFVSFGNQNTLFGVSLNMARLEEYHDCAVFEVGINKQGEMAKIVEKLQPTIAVITYIGHAHMEGLGSLAGIAAEKRDIFKYFKEDSIGIINGDQPLLSAVGYPHPVIKFGTKTTNQIQARKIKQFGDHIAFSLKLYGKKYDVTLQDPRKECINNILAAAATACLLAIDHAIIIDEIQKQQKPARRFQSCPLKHYPGVMIDDAYNASPESVKAALLALQQLKTKAKKIVVLGDMLELGINSAFWHRQIGRFLRKTPAVKDLILVGNQVQWTQKTVPVGVNVELVPSWREAAVTLQTKLDTESVILVKGSNSLDLSKLVDQFADTSSTTETLS